MSSLHLQNNVCTICTYSKEKPSVNFFWIFFYRIFIIISHFRGVCSPCFFEIPDDIGSNQYMLYRVCLVVMWLLSVWYHANFLVTIALLGHIPVEFPPWFYSFAVLSIHLFHSLSSFSLPSTSPCLCLLLQPLAFSLSLSPLSSLFSHFHFIPCWGFGKENPFKLHIFSIWHIENMNIYIFTIKNHIRTETSRIYAELMWIIM